MSLEKEVEAHLEKGVTDSEEIDFAGDSSLPSPPTLTEEEERRLWRKIDQRLMPILALMYLLSFMDRGEFYIFFDSTRHLSVSKGNIGNARLQGLQTQLHLSDNQFNLALVSIACQTQPCFIAVFNHALKTMYFIVRHLKLCLPSVATPDDHI